MPNILYVFVGGGLGAVLRFLLSGFVQKGLPGVFPWGTLTVNLLGCFMIGLLWSFSSRGNWGSMATLFFIPGVLGGFTTFSSFGLESINLFQSGHWRSAIIYVSASNILGLCLAAVGARAGLLLIK